MIKKIFNKKAGLTYFQILNLILFTVSFSFLVSILGVDTVLADTDLTANCCDTTTTGATCVQLTTDECSTQCSGSCIPTTCDQYSPCVEGCCYDSSEGWCSMNSPRFTCEAGGGVWSNSETCGIPECNLGCCILGTQARFVTEGQCQKLSADASLEINYDAGITTEIECLAQVASLTEGACILSSGDCRFLTEQECYSLGADPTQGGFRAGYLCSHPDLNSSCIKQNYTSCIEGKDEVYWFDSCGNKENIYSSDLDASWNNGQVLTKSESCGAGQNNANSPDCGNCDYFLGSRCENYEDAGGNEPTYGENICRDLKCYGAPDNNGQTSNRENGESWCVFDGAIGDGQDLVGSRHWKYTCMEGEVEVEPCADFRNEICVQEDDGETGFSIASCRLNQWQNCNFGDSASYSSSDASTIDCDQKHVFISDEIQFDVLTPKYSPGFDYVDNYDAAESICTQANFNCTVYYVKEMGSWKCVANCECEEESFSQNLVEWCSSLGDCGYKMNIVGDTNKAYLLYGDPTPDAGQLKGSLEWNDVYPEPGDVESFLSGSSSEDLAAAREQAENPEAPEDTAGSIASGAAAFGGVVAALGVGAIALGATTVPVTIIGGTANGFATVSYMSLGGTVQSGAVPLSTVGGATSGTASVAPTAITATAGGGAPVGTAAPAAPLISPAFAGGAIGLGIGMLVGALLASALGLDPVGTVLMMAGFGLAGLAIGVSIVTNTWWCVPCLVIAAILIIISLFFGGGTKEKHIYFECHPWQPPTGSAKCDECNGDDMKPCSKYRCQSLGTACEFINEGTDYEMCDKIEDNGLAPTISPWEEIITEGYAYRDVSSTSMRVAEESETCIPAFTTIEFGIQTSEPAQCKWDTESTTSFDDMSYYFGGYGAFVTNHSTPFMMPSVQSIADQYTINVYEVERLAGNLHLYVRCQDRYGDVNPTEYVIDICVNPEDDQTTPRIQNTNPANPSYVRYGETNKTVDFFTNEPAQCKWDTTDKNYESMANLMSCQYDLGQSTIDGWRCSTLFTNLTSTTNTRYVKCKDQPYAPETERNAMQESYEYVLKSSLTPLSISSTQPHGTEEVGGGSTRLTSTTLEITTTGGAESGKALCEYNFVGSTYIPFFNTGRTSHTQVLSTIIPTNYSIPVRCTDVAGNVANDTIAWGYSIDSTPPTVVRVYNSGGITITTNENAECAYEFDNCFIDWGNTTMMSGTGLTHSADWDTTKTYYILCRDSFGNVEGDCSIVVRPSDLV